jgi:hypothetical protein
MSEFDIAIMDGIDKIIKGIDQVLVKEEKELNNDEHEE